MADRFYTADELGPGEYVLTGPESHHLATVCRITAGAHVVLFNGNGHDYPAEVTSVSKRCVTLNVLACEPADRELPFPLVVASALPKGDRADFLIEKLTELGVTRFVPLVTTRTVVQPKASAVEKFTRAVIEASKQCGRNRLMAVDPPRRWSGLLALPELPAQRLILHTGPDLTEMRAAAGRDGAMVAVGPEGGFTSEEVAEARAKGWTAASLGPRVLRVETAALAAVTRLSEPTR